MGRCRDNCLMQNMGCVFFFPCMGEDTLEVPQACFLIYNLVLSQLYTPSPWVSKREAPFAQECRMSLSLDECGAGILPPSVRSQTCSLILIDLLSLRIPQDGHQRAQWPRLEHFSCTGALMGSGGVPLLSRWHQDSITYPKWSPLIQKHPAGLRLDPSRVHPDQVAVGLAGVPRGTWAKQY